MNYVVVIAGGVGSRMKGVTQPKQFIEYHGKPIFVYTLEKFERHPLVDGIVLVCLDSYLEYAKECVFKFELRKIKKIVPGGRTGQESIYDGLRAIREFAFDNDIVLIHDAVRPFVSVNVINQVIEQTRVKGNAITVSPANETVLTVRGEKIVKVLERNVCYFAKAPQCFYLKDIWDAHQMALRDKRNDFVDSSSMMTHYGYELNTVDSNIGNIKITSMDDFNYFCYVVDKSFQLA